MAWCPRASSSVPHTEGSSLKAHLTVSALSARLRRVADDGSRWRGPVSPHGFQCRRRMGPPPRSFAADAHHCIMVRALLAHRIQGCGTILRRAQHAGSPRYRHPDHTSVPSCSEPSRCGLAMMGARGNVGATANLDRSCARQRLGLWVGAKKRAPDRTKKLTKKKMSPCGEA